MDLYTPLADLAADLEAAGIRATIDGQDLNPPAVYVALGPVDGFTFCGGEMAAELFVTVGDLPESRALKALSPLLAGLLEYLAEHGHPLTAPITPELVQPASGGTPLPALKVTTALTV